VTGARTGRPLRSRPVFTLAGATAPVRTYTDGITLGRPGRCPRRPVLLITLFDNSGSVVGGNDPIGQRFVETGLAVSRIGARCRCRRDLMAVLHFDTPTSLDLQPTPIIRSNWAAVGQSLAVPPDGPGISELGPSLRAAEALAAAHPDHLPVLVALTDFELFDPDLDAVYGELAGFPGQVHAVVLRAAPPPRLTELPAVAVVPISYTSQPGSVARAVFGALATTRPDARPLPPR
jgi:hypothetical protein